MQESLFLYIQTKLNLLFLSWINKYKSKSGNPVDAYINLDWDEDSATNEFKHHIILRGSFCQPRTLPSPLSGIATPGAVSSWKRMSNSVLLKIISWSHRYGDKWVLGHIYNMKSQFWAVGCGLDCEKKGLGRLWATFEVCFFKFSWVKN